MKIINTRLSYFIAFLLTIGLLGTAIYLQHQDGIIPCPLCILQRISLGLLGVVFFFGAILSFYPLRKTFIGLSAFVISLLGLFFAGRQVWIQHLPNAQHTECGASLNYLFKVLPFDQALKKVLQGSAECTQVGDFFLGLNLAEWSLLWFIAFAFFSLFQLFRRSF